MPIIRTFRRDDPQIEDFEEIFAPDVYPIFVSIDYEIGTPDSVEVSEGEQVKSDEENILFRVSFWEKWLFVLKKK